MCLWPSGYGPRALHERHVCQPRGDSKTCFSQSADSVRCGASAKARREKGWHLVRYQRDTRKALYERHFSEILMLVWRCQPTHSREEVFVWVCIGCTLKGGVRQHSVLRRVLKRSWTGFWRRVLRRVLRRESAMGFTVKKRVLRRVLRKGPEKGFPEGA